MSKVASKRPSTQHPAQHRAPLTSAARERRRSVPSVDPLPIGGKVALDALATISNRAQLAALSRVEANQARSARDVHAIRSIGIAILGLLTLAVGVLIVAIVVLGGRIDSVERRVERLENFHQESTR